MYITRLCNIVRVCQKRLDLKKIKRTAPKIFFLKKNKKTLIKQWMYIYNMTLFKSIV